MLKTELPENGLQKNGPPESNPPKSCAPFGAAQAREARSAGDARDSRGAAPIDEPDGKKLEIIRQYVAEVKFGSVTILIQDGKVVQIEKTEKKRFR
jgi:hypothetical protein